jgi:major intracellular serine protease
MAIIKTYTVKTAAGSTSYISRDGVVTMASIYGSNGHLDKLLNYTTKGVLEYTISYSYNQSGQMAGSIKTDATGKVIDTIKYSYDAKGAISDISHLNIMGNMVSNIHYNSDGTTTKTTYVAPVSTVPVDWSSTYGHGEIDVLKALKLAGLSISDTISTTKVGWNITAGHFDDAWNAGLTGKGVTVAVIDSGIDLKNPTLTKNISADSWNFIAKSSNVQDDFGHGTFVASEIGASRFDGDGIVGGAYDSNLLILKVANEKGAATTQNVADAIRYAVDHHADVISLSLYSAVKQPLIESALAYANAHDVLVSIISGNSGKVSPDYPAIYAKTNDNVISVGATSSISRMADNFANYSNKAGTNIEYNYVVAPGTLVDGLGLNGKIIKMSGTSMAAPMVAAEMAILQQYLEGTGKYLKSDIDEMVMDYVIHGTNQVGLIGVTPIPDSLLIV